MGEREKASKGSLTARVRPEGRERKQDGKGDGEEGSRGPWRSDVRPAGVLSRREGQVGLDPNPILTQLVGVLGRKLSCSGGLV